MLGLKKKKPAEAAKPVDDEDVEHDEPAPEVEVDEESSVELKKAELAPKAAKGGGWLPLAISVVAITAVAAGGGIFLGQKTAATIETTIALHDAEAKKAAEEHPVALKYNGDTVVKPIEAVVTNLAAPADTWIRLETAMVFKNGDLENPEVTAAELRQDMLAYLRTVTVARLDGPSALQHLRDDLNERAALRTGGRVSEVVIQTLVIQ